MADFAHWGAAIAQALDIDPEAFLQAYRENTENKNADLLTSNPITNTILTLMENRDEWKGTPTELFDELSQIAESLKIKTTGSSWPKAPQTLTRRLNEVRTNLRQDGLEIATSHERIGRGRPERKITISKFIQQSLPISSENSVTSVTPSTLASKTVDGVVDAKTAVDEYRLQKPVSTVTASTVASTNHQSQGTHTAIGCNGVDGILPDGGKRDEKNKSLDTLPPADLLETWISKGRPIIYLGSGESCQDLEKRLGFSFNESQFKALMDWYSKNTVQEVKV